MGDLLDQLLREAQAQDRLPPPPVGRLLRERAGLSQRDIARVIGCDRASVSRWESGRRHPRRGAALQYAELLERLAQHPAAGEKGGELNTLAAVT